MKIKIGISLVLMLLIVASTFTVVGNTIRSGEGRGTALPIEVSKKVWDGSNWADSTTDYYGESVRFNVTIKYHKNCQDGLYASDIIIVDTLPSGLSYAGNANYEESYVSGSEVYWYLTLDYGIYLVDNQSVSVEFDAEIIGYNENINYVEVNAYETGCGWSLYGDDDATVNVVDPLVVNKQVYNSDTGQWVDELPGPIKKINNIKFRITITFNGYYETQLMKNMIVNDYLPACGLKYAGNEIFTYPDPNLFQNPVITVTPDLKHVKFDWTNKLFNLFAGESIVIVYETDVVEYCYAAVINSAFVDLYNWPVQLSDDDSATVNCFPPDSTIQKTVWDPVESEWVEEISVYLDDTVRFKIDLTYYGNYDLTSISIIDELHSSTEYADNANPTETDVSGNLVWWNFTEKLNDSETITIEFDALTISGTGSSPGLNTATVNALENGLPFEISDQTGVIVKINQAPSTPDITGDTNGEEGQVLTFHAVSSDPDGDNIYYKFDWGDGTFSDWLGPNPSGIEISTTNSWNNAGTYNVRAKAKDSSLGFESDWSFYPVVVKIVVPPVPSLNVTIKSGISLSISVNVENNGELDLSNIAWNITVNRIGIIKKLLWQKNDVITSLPIGDNEILIASPTGFGAFNVTVKIDAPGLDQIVLSKEGLVIWKIILL